MRGRLARSEEAAWTEPQAGERLEEETKARPSLRTAALLCPGWPAVLRSSHQLPRARLRMRPPHADPGIRGEPVLSWWNRALRLQGRRPRSSRSTDLKTTIQPGLCARPGAGGRTADIAVGSLVRVQERSCILWSTSIMSDT